MAKAYSWSDTTWQISPTGGTEGDPITFKDITDYYEANPLPLDYNIPRYLGGLVYILGDQNTFIGVAGDTIKVTIDGIDYDDIDIAAATSIADVVTAINVIAPGTPASESGGYLKIESPTEEYDSGEVQINDGTSTVNPCVARLFSVANNRDSTNFSFPYELTENNASEWFEIGGFLAPTDDAADFCEGMASVTAEVDSVPTGTNITRVNSTSTTIYVYMTDTSAFALHEEVIITGTTNFNGIIFRVTGISASVYVGGYRPRDCPIIDETSIVGATLIKPLTLVWNNSYGVPYKSITIADKIRLSVKSDGVGSPKIIGVIVRNYYGTGSPNYFHFGAYYKTEWDLTSVWQDFEIDIKSEMKGYNWVAYSTFYGMYYWNHFAKFYIMFDGLSVGESVWIDGVRFTCTNPNPIRIAENNFIFPVALNLFSWFKDSGFNCRFDLLDNLGGNDSTDVLTATATNIGEIQFGDYTATYTKYRKGGVFIFNMDVLESVGFANFTKCYLQGITLMGFKDQQVSQNLKGGDNIFRDCNFIDVVINNSQSGTSFVDGAWMGGLYFIYLPLNITVNGMTIYGIRNYALFVRAYADPVTLSNIKMIDTTGGKTLLGSDTIGSTITKQEGLRLNNFDVASCSTTCNILIANYAAQMPYTISHYISFSFNLKVIDNFGNAINGVTVILKDKDDNQLFSTITDSNGQITEQIVDILKAYFPNVGSASKFFFFETPLVDWTHYYPYTLIVKKQGYMTYKTKFMNTYTRNLEIAKKGANWEVTLFKSPYTKILGIN